MKIKPTLLIPSATAHWRAPCALLAGVLLIRHAHLPHRMHLLSPRIHRHRLAHGIPHCVSEEGEVMIWLTHFGVLPRFSDCIDRGGGGGLLWSGCFYAGETTRFEMETKVVPGE